MSKDSRFWRNVTLIALAHVALVAGFIRWSVEARSSSNAQSVVWLGDAGGASTATEPMTGEPPQPAKLSPSPERRLPKSDEAEDQEPLLTATKSEIELPSPTPTPTSTPMPPATPTAKPKATPKPAPKPTPKPIPKKPPKAKSNPTKSAEKAKKSDANAEKKKIAKAASAKNGSPSQDSTGKGSSAGKGGHAAGGKSASEFGWYGNMLHDRFYSAWIQPTTTVASGTRISTLVRVRIEKDGRVSNFEIIKPSENIVVNESVAAIAKRVTQVDPLPAGLGNGDHYDVRINFELNTEQETAH
jgi:TonB family protein